MEKKSVNIEYAVNTLKETIHTAVAELKSVIKDRLSTLEVVKQDLAYAYSEVEDICEIADNLSVDMEILAEETNDVIDTLGDVLAIISPEEFGDFEEEDFEEDEPCVVVEDTETGEETEYPIN